MRHGYLSEYFDGAAAKRLSVVEADVLRSNQHEFNGDEQLKRVLGEPEGKVRLRARLFYFSDREDETTAAEAEFTWYDARARGRRERGIMRWEYRLYFPDTPVSELARPGDLLLIARRTDGSLLVVVAAEGSTTERQLLWLFGLETLPETGYSSSAGFEDESNRIGFAGRFILEELGIEIRDDTSGFLDDLLRTFGTTFPATAEFSAYARRTLADNVDPLKAPDEAVMAFMEREELLFRTLERHLLTERLLALQRQGIDPDAFMQLAMSFMQRRRSRAGSALENHLEHVFMVHGVRYERWGITERKLRPDFLFPDAAAYHSKDWPVHRLAMLAVKTTCRDRWRQILNEAARIRTKHLFTLEPGISASQTAEMEAESVQLVVPAALVSTFAPEQRTTLWTLAGLLEWLQHQQEVP